jgi:GNAT superfamily N-acetyltransferase
MTVSADELAGALNDSFGQFIPTIPGAWADPLNGILTAYSGIDVPSLNGVWVERLDSEPGTVAEQLDRLAETGAPHCLSFRPGSAAALEPLAKTRKLVRQRDIPLMLLEPGPDYRALAAPAGLRIRELRSDQVRSHVDVAARGFGIPAEMFKLLLTEEAVELPGTRCYLGEVDDEPVVTGVARLLDGLVGVFNIATLPEHTRRGYGAALTSRACADAAADGARGVWLQASADGYPVYERLGFHTVENWQSWFTAAPGS